MAAEDLTTLANAKAWLQVSQSTDDVLLAGLISSASRLICGFTGRPSFLSRRYTEVLDGNGKDAILLPVGPVTSISALSVSGIAYTASAWSGGGVQPPAGYLLEPWDGRPPERLQRLRLSGGWFVSGPSNVALTCQAGYATFAEPQTVGPAIPTSPTSAVADQLYGAWAQDLGVVNAATGVALSRVAAGSTPTAGQYAIGAAAPGQYIFAAADLGLAVLLTYGWVPHDIVQATTETVGERYRYLRRIGELSKQIGGQETASYSVVDLPAFVKASLQPYVRVAPV